MTDRSKNNAFSLFIKFSLTVNIIIVIVGMVMLFITSDVYGVYATAFCSSSAVLNSVGLTLIMRWHKCGVIFVVLASLLSTVVLSITCAGWLTYSLGRMGIFIPYIVIVMYLGSLLVLLFRKIEGKSSWQRMDYSLDLTHFRHIYQLSTIALLFISVSAYFVMPSKAEIGLTEDQKIEEIVADVPLSRLDSPDVTIEEIVSFEENYNKITSVEMRDHKITNRIFALKHLLLSGLMPDIHNRDNLVNICMVHAGSFSEQQQEIIDWYMSLSISQQSEWNVCDNVNTLSEFKKIVQTKIQ